MRSLIALVLAGLAACAPKPYYQAAPIPPLLPADQGAASMAVEFAKISIKQLREYVDALVLCGSPVPSDWAEARNRLDVMHPFHVFKEDPQLIAGLRRGEEPARRELARRGGLLRAMLTFSGKHDRLKWDEARKTLMAGGEAGEALLCTVLMQMLIDGAARDNWEHLRTQVVETGKPALETAIALAREIAKTIPAETAVFPHDDLTQLFLVLIEFGDAGRGAVEEFSKHEKPNVRRCMAESIGEARDDLMATTLAQYLSTDPSWIVRAAAAEACRRMGPSKRLLGPLLTARVGKEKEGYVLRRVLRAIGDIGWAEGVPALIAALESPSLETAESAMAALYVLTGERFLKREKWEQWYRTSYPGWKAKQAR
ncbi:MAG TPA: HEAT repeat domain-containing protein [Planctomycetota bacterium]